MTKEEREEILNRNKAMDKFWDGFNAIINDPILPKMPDTPTGTANKELLYKARYDVPKLLDALEKAEAQIQLLDQALSNSKPLSKTIEDFCCDEMFQKNELCRYASAMCDKCPLYKFKLYITKEEDDGNNKNL